jgi:hypothetical protein
MSLLREVLRRTVRPLPESLNARCGAHVDGDRAGCGGEAAFWASISGCGGSDRVSGGGFLAAQAATRAAIRL